MSDSPRRPTLHLRFAPATALAAPPVAKPLVWKCRPCGAQFEVPADATDSDPVRCPSCNARLGRAVDFRAAEPDLTRVRARLAEAKAPVEKPAFVRAPMRRVVVRRNP